MESLHALVDRFFQQMKDAETEITASDMDALMALADTMNRMKRAVGLLPDDA